MFIARNDYYQKYKCQIEELMDPENIRLNTEIGLPCNYYPSNHIALGYKVQLKKYYSQD